MQSIDEVLAFWFSDNSSEHWFAPKPAFDQLIRERFADLAARAADGGLRGWEESARGCVALCILLDQMPRNLFRGTPRAFATDGQALDIAARAVSRGLDQELPPEQKHFLYLPFSHSERLADQSRAAALFEAADLDEALAYVRDHHLAIIRRFGRFPHRNAILGRSSTPEELEFLAQHDEDFGQSAGGSVAEDPADQRAPAGAGDR
jgi:uncharacterized protein (DUF924 family)